MALLNWIQNNTTTTTAALLLMIVSSIAWLVMALDRRYQWGIIRVGEFEGLFVSSCVFFVGGVILLVMIGIHNDSIAKEEEARKRVRDQDEINQQRLQGLLRK